MKTIKQARSLELPTTHMMNPLRPWVSAVSTDIRATFARIRAEQEKQAAPKNKVRRIR